MNIYVVVEGSSTEPKVYPCWIREVNPLLTQVNHINEVTNNHFLIRTGGGYPFIFKMIEAAIADTNEHTNFDRLVVALDSEEASYNDRYAEIQEFIAQYNPRVEVRIIIQHFCIEAWALGNTKVLSAKPRLDKYKEYKAVFDVNTEDPELLPAYVPEDLNRAQFSKKYLNIALQNRRSHLYYSERNPQVIAQPSYFSELKKRLEGDHIKSFQHFINAFL